MNWLGIATLAASVAFSTGAAAQMRHDHHGASAQGEPKAEKVQQKAQKAHDASGSVTKADPSKGKVTIKHGPVESLKWPGMTMAFDVKDAALFDRLKPGAKIDFSFVQSGKSYVITQVK